MAVFTHSTQHHEKHLSTLSKMEGVLGVLYVREGNRSEETTADLGARWASSEFLSTGDAGRLRADQPIECRAAETALHLLMDTFQKASRFSVSPLPSPDWKVRIIPCSYHSGVTLHLTQDRSTPLTLGVAYRSSHEVSKSIMRVIRRVVRVEKEKKSAAPDPFTALCS